MFKECLRHDIMPFILDDKRRNSYLAGVRGWDIDQVLLLEICTEVQTHLQKYIELEGLVEARSHNVRCTF